MQNNIKLDNLAVGKALKKTVMVNNVNHPNPTTREGLESNGKSEYIIKYSKGNATHIKLLVKKVHQNPKLLIKGPPTEEGFVER